MNISSRHKFSLDYCSFWLERRKRSSVRENGSEIEIYYAVSYVMDVVVNINKFDHWMEILQKPVVGSIDFILPLRYF